MENTVRKILGGDKEALEELVKKVQQKIFNLALRFLWKKEDAEDATQEILIKIITNLSKFEFKSQFNTWAYRIAVNHLLNVKKNSLEQHLSFSVFGEDLISGLQSPSYDLPDKELLAEEVKIGCTLGMLLCLDRNLRIAYILGEVFELNSYEASEILEITPENFRKRLSQARAALQKFMHSYCGLTNNKNPCRCNKRINYAIHTGKVNTSHLNFVSSVILENSKNEIEELYSASAVFKSHPEFLIDSTKTKEIHHIISNLNYI